MNANDSNAIAGTLIVTAMPLLKDRNASVNESLAVMTAFNINLMLNLAGMSSGGKDPAELVEIVATEMMPIVIRNLAGGLGSVATGRVPNVTMDKNGPVMDPPKGGTDGAS